MRPSEEQVAEERLAAFLAALDKAMAETGISKAKLAKEVDYSAQHIGDILKRKAKPGGKLQAAIAKAFEYETLGDFLEYGRGLNALNGAARALTPRSTITRKIVGLDDSGELIVEEDACDAHTPQENMEALGLTADQLCIYVVCDDSMFPQIPKNSLAFVNLTNTTVQTGAAYLVRVGEELAIRWIESIPDGLRVRASQSGVTPFVASGKNLPGFRLFGRVELVHQPPTTVQFYSS